MATQLGNSVAFRSLEGLLMRSALIDGQGNTIVLRGDVNLTIFRIILKAILQARDGLAILEHDIELSGGLGLNLSNLQRDNAILNKLAAPGNNLITLGSINGIGPSTIGSTIGNSSSLAAIGAANINLIVGSIKLEGVGLANVLLGVSVDERYRKTSLSLCIQNSSGLAVSAQSLSLLGGQGSGSASIVPTSEGVAIDTLDSGQGQFLAGLVEVNGSIAIINLLEVAVIGDLHGVGVNQDINFHDGVSHNGSLLCNSAELQGSLANSQVRGDIVKGQLSLVANIGPTLKLVAIDALNRRHRNSAISCFNSSRSITIVTSKATRIGNFNLICIPAQVYNYVRIICKCCKRNAHDEHESGSQQSQQTSFEVRFLHVNFSYSLKFI